MELLALILIGYFLLRKQQDASLGLWTLGKISYDELVTDMSRVRQYWPTILSESLKKGIDPCLTAAIIHRESQGHANPPNPKAHGLMQVITSTARMFGFQGQINWLKEPKTNIKIGTNYLSYLLKRYKDWDKAVSAYNWGSPTEKNRAYVKDVRELAKIYCASPSSLLTATAVGG